MTRRIVFTNEGGLEIKEPKKKEKRSTESSVDQYPLLETTRQRKARVWKEEANLHAVENSEKKLGVMGVVEDPIDLAHIIDAVGLKIPRPKH